jgi:carboxyl-terminal processing protease
MQESPVYCQFFKLMVLTMLALLLIGCTGPGVHIAVVTLSSLAPALDVEMPVTTPTPVATLSEEDRTKLLRAVVGYLNVNWPRTAGKPIDWSALGAEYTPRIQAADSDAEIYRLINEMLAQSGDERVYLVTPEEIAATEAWQAEQSRFSGIGTRVTYLDDALVVVQPFPGSPAERAGLQPGERILAVDGMPVTGLEEAIRRIRGPAGSDVVLAVLSHDDRKRQVTVTRGAIDMSRVSNVEATVLPGTRIGYVIIYDFSMSEHLHNALRDLAIEDELEGLIIDLRHNPGGNLSMATAATGFFTPLGVVVRIGNERLFVRDSRLPELRDLPMAVLIEADLNIAGQTFAAGLRALGDATLVGMPAGGAFLWAAAHDLPLNTTLYIPGEPLYYVDGSLLDGAGISPDVEVAGEWWRYPDPRHDPQVQAALEVLQE